MSDSAPYNPKDPISICLYAKQLENKSLRQIIGDDIEIKYSGKGKLGQLLEDQYFKYLPNSKSEPDFFEAGVELKTTPLKRNSKGLVSKERLVFNIINFEEEYKHSFENSSFWKKNQLILIVFYLFEKDQLEIDFVFKIARLWRFPSTDLKIIMDDWNKIVSKIKAGKAHEISEGDTLYLGACTKGSTSKQSKRKQPFSAILAPQRAFSLKSKYINFIIEKSLNGDFALPAFDEEYKRVLGSQLESYTKIYDASTLGMEDREAVIKNVSEYQEGQTFEDVILEKFQKFIGFSEQEIVTHFGLDLNLKAKNKNYVLAKAILGVTKQKIEEFEKAEIVLKTIKLENNGILKESMSFAQIKFSEIITEKWEESYLFTTLTRRFFFVVFKKDKDNVSRLHGVKFWTMPYSDLSIAKEFWNHTKQMVVAGIYNQFWKMKDHNIFHVRPKGINSSDLVSTPQGTMEKKKSYWLNSRYILGQISSISELKSSI